jgi:hypothetical protein
VAKYAATREAADPEPAGMFVPDVITNNDFFRLKRVGNCWQVEMVRTLGDKVMWRRDVYAEDILPNVWSRLERHVIDAELER